MLCVEDDQNIPLVPLTDEQESAMDSRTFQTLLTAVGVLKPANEQVINRLTCSSLSHI